jgi:adenine-specific DNA-methyltransferase
VNTLDRAPAGGRYLPRPRGTRPLTLNQRHIVTATVKTATYSDHLAHHERTDAQLCPNYAASIPIKYLGSKRRLVPVITALAQAIEARRALDLFTGTTRVAQALKRTGAHVTAVDSATYAHVLAEAYVATDGRIVNAAEVKSILDRLSARPPRRGYVTRVFCERARYFHPDNGARIDAIRDAIEEEHAGTSLYPLLLTSLLEASDRVDSTTGVQMAYLKEWAPRALRPLELRMPSLLEGPGTALLGDALRTAQAGLGEFDFAYLDPPYNQHRYYTNYHVWETLVRWDAPEHYGVACKRVDCRDPSSQSPFNRRRSLAGELRAVIATIGARLLAVSYNDESWLGLDELTEMCEDRGEVGVLSFDSKRYVGAQIGIHNPRGEKVGAVSHLRNTEIIVLSGDGELVAKAMEAAAQSAQSARPPLAAQSFQT